MHLIRRVAGNRTKRRRAMDKQIIKRGAALIAAAATTLVIFSAVVSVADHDRAALLAAQIKPTTVASTSGNSSHQ